MKNTYSLIWSLRAVENLKKIINYLEENWTDKEIKNFSIQLHSYLTIIEQIPKTFPEAKSKQNIRRAVISPQHTLYYKIETNSIMLIALFDNRQDPKKRKI